jgi:hypothetical protein
MIAAQSLQADRADVEALRETWQSWSVTLAQAQGAPADSIPAETLATARQILKKVMADAIAVGPYKVIDGAQTWTFHGYSRFDGVVMGGLTHGYGMAIRLADSATGETIKSTWDEVTASYRLPPIAGGSDAVDTGGVCQAGRDTDMAPHTPHSLRAPRETGALLDVRLPGAPDGPPHPPLAPSAPGNRGAPRCPVAGGARWPHSPGF